MLISSQFKISGHSLETVFTTLPPGTVCPYHDSDTSRRVFVSPKLSQSPIECSQLLVMGEVLSHEREASQITESSSTYLFTCPVHGLLERFVGPMIF